jgi:hypothetical protein
MIRGTELLRRKRFMRIQKVAVLTTLLAARSCWAQVTFPTYDYYLPALSQNGGPVYVIPGTVTPQTQIALTASGIACLKVGFCLNPGGVGTIGNLNPQGTKPEYGHKYKPAFPMSVGRYNGLWDLGSLLVAVNGGRPKEVFNEASTSPNLPPSSLTTTLTFGDLGVITSIQNPQLTFYVADNYYPDNYGGFLLALLSPTLTYNALSPTSKVMQMVGPCDWQTWSPAIKCDPTAASQFPSQVLGMDQGFSFIDADGQDRIFLFGDTIGTTAAGTALVPAVQQPSQFPSFGGHDAFARTSVLSSPSSFALDFYLRKTSRDTDPNGYPLFVRPRDADGTEVPMGGDDVPNSGIAVNGIDYIIVNTGSNTGLPNPFLYDKSLLVAYKDPSNKYLFELVRPTPVSTANKMVNGNPVPAGHFVFDSLIALPTAFGEQIGYPDPQILIFGIGQHGAESIYLSMTPAADFVAKAIPPTLYFAGLDNNGQPLWTNTELCTVPVVYDNPYNTPLVPVLLPGCPTTTGAPIYAPTDPGTAITPSVSYNSQLALWLMTFGGGNQPAPVTGIQNPGIYFSYASAPWGPWSKPEMIYNPCRAHTYGQGYGDFIRYTYQGDKISTPGRVNRDDLCAVLDPTNIIPVQQIPPGSPSNPGTKTVWGTGPIGPMIGAQTNNLPDPFYGTTSNNSTPTTSRGHVYGPYQIDSFASVTSTGLDMYYNMATWNPYTVLLMNTLFLTAPPATVTTNASN